MYNLNINDNNIISFKRGGNFKVAAKKTHSWFSPNLLFSDTIQIQVMSLVF